MKLRKPSLSLPPLDRPIISVPNGQSYRITTLTPIYGGGIKPGEPDLLMPVRASAIRGQLRFWWRLLKLHHPETPLTGIGLFESEREVWGGMSEAENDYSSKVKLRVTGIDLPKVESLTKPCATYAEDPKYPGKLKSLPDFSPQISSYALFPGKGELDQNRNAIEKMPANVVMAGLTFYLQIECLPKYLVEVTETLRWWASFGGLGARTRRGLGAVKIDGLKHIQRDEAERYGCKLAIKPPSSDAIAAWHRAVSALQNFRQGENLGRRPGQQANRPGRSRWPEPASIRAITGIHRIKADGVSFQPTDRDRRYFPRAAFGLPIIFHFQNQREDQARDPDDCELKPVGHDRMASPLILKAIALDDGRYAPMALLMPLQHLQNVNLELRNSGSNARNPNLPYILASGVWWPLQADNMQRAISTVKPLTEQQSDNALDAFLNYFSKG